MARWLAIALACGCATSPPVTTDAVLAVTPDDSVLARQIRTQHLSAFVTPAGDAWQLAFSPAVAGTPCTEAPPGDNSLTFFVPTTPPLVAPADGSIAEPIDVAVETTPLGLGSPHAELDLAVATRETVGALYFHPSRTGFAGTFDATTTAETTLLHVTGSFDAPICDQ
jgi:hypothetical protein